MPDGKGLAKSESTQPYAKRSTCLSGAKKELHFDIDNDVWVETSLLPRLSKAFSRSNCAVFVTGVLNLHLSFSLQLNQSFFAFSINAIFSLIKMLAAQTMVTNSTELILQMLSVIVEIGSNTSKCECLGRYANR